eukprot:403343714
MDLMNQFNRKIGVGSLGEVHLVQKNNIQYAMKIVQFDMDDEEQQYDLLNEVHIIKHLGQQVPVQECRLLREYQ